MSINRSSRRGRGRSRNKQTKRNHNLKAGGLTATFYTVAGVCAGAAVPFAEGLYKLSNSMGGDTAYDLTSGSVAICAAGIVAVSARLAFKMTKKYKVDPLVKIFPGVIGIGAGVLIGVNVASGVVDKSEFFSTQGNKQGEWKKESQRIREQEYFTPGSSS